MKSRTVVVAPLRKSTQPSREENWLHAPLRSQVVACLKELHNAREWLLAAATELLERAEVSRGCDDFSAAVSELDVVHVYLTLYLRTDPYELKQLDLAAFPFEPLLTEEGSTERKREVASWGVDDGPTALEARWVWKRYDAIFRSLRAVVPKAPPTLGRVGGRLEP